MAKEIVVVGAGIIGTCTALELRLRGHHVTLVDRRPPGGETSYGNAGVIQREAVEPYGFPRDPMTMLTAALNRRLDVRYHLAGLRIAWPSLLRYWWHSAPRRHRVISQAYASLIAHATTEHQRYVTLADAEDLVRRDGLRMVYRTPAALDRAIAESARLADEHGIGYMAMDSAALAGAEPALQLRSLAGAVHWTDSWSVGDPGALVERYAALFLERGGRWLLADADSLRETATGWRIDAREGAVHAQHAVIALGPWAGRLAHRLGYRLPLFAKRGYHRHYTGGASVAVPTLDAERGYVLAPQLRGLRLTTGAELAALDAPPTPVQMGLAETQARQLLDIGTPVEATPWIGARPCSADMKPLIGPASRHRGLWFNFGHGHQGFTLGPASARLLADLMECQEPFLDAKPFCPSRFD
ncbi:NAD(P)/FAD-dependent oxidoreductase [Roseateles cavernae]|uniref:NAD(P)/FAD-dependent oxidoreductase n=1 Tax=Roseateles cavernae TaxID=3153578 RepID=UPI0032E4355F